MSPQRLNLTKAAVIWLMQHCFWAAGMVYIFKSPQRQLEVRGQEQFSRSAKYLEKKQRRRKKNQNVFNGIIMAISNCMITSKGWDIMGAGFAIQPWSLACISKAFFAFFLSLGYLLYSRIYPLQHWAGSALQSLNPEARSSADIWAPGEAVGRWGERRQGSGAVPLDMRYFHKNTK